MHLQENIILQGGKYRIKRFINSGGFGCTYEAEHVMLHKRLAIKEFFVKDFCNRDEQTGNISVGTQSKVALVERLKAKFIDEAVALSQMNHLNIVQVTDVFIENGTAYYVMDYIDGCSLDEKVKRQGYLLEHEALAYIRQVAEALDYVHGQNRLHLDIKPGNIMVDSSNRAILIDFGVSKQYDSVEGENTSTLLGKTPGYAPIEQMGNSVQQFTPATDIYALGATLYKLLSGTTPPESTIIINDGIPSLDASVSEQTKNAVYKAMEFRRNDRPQTIKEFLSMLGNSVEKDKEDICINDCENEHIKDNKDDFVVPVSDEETIILDKEKETVSSKKEQALHGVCNGHEWIDLGLSVKWATCNVGANAPEEYGDYFAWGEISTKVDFFEDTYKVVKKYTRIFTKRKMEEIKSIKGLSTYDAASANWGYQWCIPTKEEMEELCQRCVWTWINRKGRKGYEVVGPNGNRIFIPAAGWILGYGRGANWKNEYGYLWSSSANGNNIREAYGIGFYKNRSNSVGSYPRYYGFSIRPTLRLVI